MATLASIPFQRPKKMVRYGKAASRSTWNTKHVDDWLEEERQSVSTPHVTESDRMPSVKATYLAQKPDGKRSRIAAEVKKHASQPVAKRVRKQDPFDVPSSEDEAESSFTPRHVSPPGSKVKRTLVDDSQIGEPPLAPWEQAKSKPAPMRQSKESLSPGQQMRKDLAEDTRRTLAHRRVPSRKESNEINTAPAGGDAQNATARKSEPTGAAARLAARRQRAPKSYESTGTGKVTLATVPTKRAGATPTTSRKRSRKSPLDDLAEEDVLMTNAVSTTLCEMPEPPVETTATTDIYDVPADDASVATTRKPTASSRQVNPRRTQRGKPTPPSSRTPKKGSSAPSRLAEMVTVDADGTTASSSPSAPRSPASTPRHSAASLANQHLATPPARTSSSPQTARKITGGQTPKQTQLWSQLLSSDPPAPSPSALAIRELTIGGRRCSGDAVPLPRPSMLKSKSDVPEMHRRRTRLVDRLKASVPSSDGESSEEDSDAEMDDPAVASSAAANQAKESRELKGANNSQSHGPSQSQGQSQSQAAAEGGPRITYASTRSYLPEDNLEDGLLLGLPSITPQRPPTLPRQTSKANGDPQKSGFDLDEDEEENTQGRMRTIHELRAAGRNNRFTQEVESLLEDVADHSATSRSRRRSALIELATKLMDKSYTERFIAQGFELKLVPEINAASDTVADFALSAALAMLLVAEPPEHTVTALKAADAISWLVALLSIDADIVKLAKDRKNNMSKAAQGTLIDFAKQVQEQPQLWDKMAPISLSPRLIALRALDLLVSKLRRLGDRAELLDAEQLQLVLPVTTPMNSVDFDISLAVSVLEALSSSAQTLTWPIDLLERLAILLPQLAEENAAPIHTLFLALRLTLNLTNDNARNCQIFAREEAVKYLLGAVETGFAALNTPKSDEDAEQQALIYDLLVLAMGCMINLAEHSETARQHSINTTTTPTTEALLAVFAKAQERMEDAESLSEGNTNVASGYLAVMLANMCQTAETRAFVTGKLPGKKIGTLVEAVQEFVRHHERVDASWEGAEGREVWGAFTEKLRGVVRRLTAVVA